MYEFVLWFYNYLSYEQYKKKRNKVVAVLHENVEKLRSGWTKAFNSPAKRTVDTDIYMYDKRIFSIS